jgi:hypothetical protein
MMQHVMVHKAVVSLDIVSERKKLLEKQGWGLCRASYIYQTKIPIRVCVQADMPCKLRERILHRNVVELALRGSFDDKCIEVPVSVRHLMVWSGFTGYITVTNAVEQLTLVRIDSDLKDLLTIAKTLALPWIKKLNLVGNIAQCPCCITSLTLPPELAEITFEHCDGFPQEYPNSLTTMVLVRCFLPKVFQLPSNLKKLIFSSVSSVDAYKISRSYSTDSCSDSDTSSNSSDSDDSDCVCHDCMNDRGEVLSVLPKFNDGLKLLWLEVAVIDAQLIKLPSSLEVLTIGSERIDSVVNGKIRLPPNLKELYVYSSTLDEKKLGKLPKSLQIIELF